MGWVIFFVGLALVLLIVSVLPALIIIGTLATIAYFSGRHFHSQVTHRYRLTFESSLLLGLIALLSLLCASLIVRSTDTVTIPLQLLFQPEEIPSGWLLFPLWILFFLVSAVALLEVWGWTKRWPHIRQIRDLRSQEVDTSGEKRSLERQTERFRARLQQINQAHGTQINQQEELEELAIELLQSGNPRVLQVVRRRRAAALAREKERKLHRREQEVLRELQHAPEDQRLPKALEAADIRLERLKRRIGRPSKERRAYQEQLRRCENRRHALTQKLQSLTARRERAEGRYEALCRSRITLD